jgi:hypothetical protein
MEPIVSQFAVFPHDLSCAALKHPEPRDAGDPAVFISWQARGRADSVHLTAAAECSGS